MHAPEECLLDAIAMALVSDGEITEDEVAFAVKIARDLPPFAGRAESALEAAVGEAFERFVSEGREARLGALAAAKLDREARIEVLTTAVLVLKADARVDRDEAEFAAILARAIGASDEERAKILSAV